MDTLGPKMFKLIWSGNDTLHMLLVTSLQTIYGPLLQKRPLQEKCHFHANG